VAVAARVLWTFRFTGLGESPEGWLLNGEAWPDDTSASRSSPVDVRIRVSENWRTNTFLDGLLPAIDATVVGISAPCPGEPRRANDPHTEVVDRAMLTVMPLLPTIISADGIPIPDMLKTGGSSSEFIGSSVAARICVAKVLQAPYELLTESLVSDDDSLRQTFSQLDGQRDGELRDVIRLTGGPFVDMSLLIFARSKMVEGGLIRVRAFAAGGIELEGITVSFTNIISEAQLPPRWTNVSGPWWDDILLVRRFFPILTRGEGGWGQYLVRIRLPVTALIIDIGIAPLAMAMHNFGMNPPALYLGAIDALSQQEVLREEDDSKEASEDKDALEDALDDQQHALLFPNSRYDVVVTYDGQIGKKRENPSENEDPNEIVVVRSTEPGGLTTSRTFFTDSQPPRNLNPWMLGQFPAPDELYHFYEDPIVLVFATDDVLELFAAYGKELRAVARAASFRGSDGTSEASSTHLIINDLFFHRIGGAILSPWEATVRRRLGSLTCGEFDPSANRHGQAVLPFLLDPLTDYIVDLEILNPNGTPSPIPLLPGQVGHRPLYRQGFTTSRYPTREAFANEVRTSLVKPRQINNPATLIVLPERVTDETFDLALLDAELEITPRPNSPQVWVLWDNAPLAQPIAILIETPEPLWRTRREPVAEYDQSGQYILRWTLADNLWLSVDELIRNDETELVIDGGEFVRRLTGTKSVKALTIDEFRRKFNGPKPVLSSPLPVPTTSYVERFVHDASGTRTLVILKPGLRGKTVSLGLARELHPLLDTDTTDTPLVLCEVDLDHLPWETPV
jgi:hypothetical protein